MRIFFFFFFFFFLKKKNPRYRLSRIFKPLNGRDAGVARPRDESAAQGFMMLFLGTGNPQRFERAHGKAAVRRPRTLPDFYGHFLTLFLTLPF